MGEESLLRLFHCARCSEEVRVCRACDRGQIYCKEACSAIRRRESVRRAGAKYQRSYEGSLKHSARQRQQRLAKFLAKEVTHHGFPLAPPSVMVASAAKRALAQSDEEDRDGTVADDVADRAPGYEAAGDRPPGQQLKKKKK